MRDRPGPYQAPPPAPCTDLCQRPGCVQDPTGEAASEAQKHLTLYELDLGLNHVVRKWSQPVDNGANLLVPVPGGADGPGGLLVCAENFIIYKNQVRRSAAGRAKRGPVSGGAVHGGGPAACLSGLIRNWLHSCWCLCRVALAQAHSPVHQEHRQLQDSGLLQASKSGTHRRSSPA